MGVPDIKLYVTFFQGCFVTLITERFQDGSLNADLCNHTSALCRIKGIKQFESHSFKRKCCKQWDRFWGKDFGDAPRCVTASRCSSSDKLVFPSVPQKRFPLLAGGHKRTGHHSLQPHIKRRRRTKNQEEKLWTRLHLGSGYTERCSTDHGRIRNFKVKIFRFSSRDRHCAPSYTPARFSH
ncbi:hypothetical protein ATANTOWER_016678 [Ataeniobius toweri]|uniref:Uncharacterized protein n=1 Tax=Ataeniobius toweri TaxID=208326 RepID=A0ABU7BAZ9_9TELE|nr:hypothetical protein [Ataeniobius toweri]